MEPLSGFSKRLELLWGLPSDKFCHFHRIILVTIGRLLYFLEVDLIWKLEVKLLGELNALQSQVPGIPGSMGVM